MGNDLRLIGDYLRGDAAAFERLFARHRGPLERFACYLASNPADAEDLFQATWLAALRSLSSYQGRGSFRSWLHGIALHLHHDQLRRPRVQTMPLDTQELRENEERGPERAMERSEAVRELRAALASLEPESREVLVLSKLQGLKYHEIAALLDLPIGTVKSRLHYAMAALREAMAEPTAGTACCAPTEGSNALPRRTAEPERGR